MTAESPTSCADGPGPTEALASWAATLRFDQVPTRVREAAALLTLDGLGCGLFGSTTPWGAIVRDLARTSGAGPESTLWGSGERVPAVQAPLANGTYVHSFEFDDLHPVAALHGAAQVVPAALAVAELRASGPAAGSRPSWLPDGLPTARELVVALVAGLETGARIGLATGAEQLRRGFHPSPNTGTFSAAATAARLLRLDRAATRAALGVAGSCGGSLMAAQYGAMVKRLHPGRAAQAGVTAALLAARGFTGIDDVLEAPYGGFASAYADLEPSAVGAIAAELGHDWETPRFSVKAYPCCGSSHTSIDAYLSMLEETPDLSTDDIDAIEVACSTLTYEHVGWPYQPSTVTAAQMNLPYTLAVLATDQKVFVDQFAPERVDDPDVLALASRVRVRPDEGIDTLGREGRHAVRLSLTTRGGRQLVREVHHPLGSAANPLSHDDVTAKYHGLAGKVLDPTNRIALADAVLDLGRDEPANGSVSAILAALRHATDLRRPTDEQARPAGRETT